MPVMDQHDIEAKFDESLKRFSDDDLDSDQPLLEYEFYEPGPLQRMTLRKYIPPLSTILTTLFMSLSLVILAVTFFARDLDRACLKKLTGWSPLLDVLGHNYQYLDGNTASEFTGEWTEESAVAWNDMWHYGATGISDDKLPLLNKSIATPWARHDADSPVFPGQVKALFEGFHRLHCVYLTRMYAFRDSYEFSDVSYFKVDPARLRRHVEHCIDNMRWGIHCNADVTPYLLERHVGASGNPYPRLSTGRPAKCRNIDDMYKYADENTQYGLLPIGHWTPA